VKYTPFYHKSTFNFGGRLQSFPSTLVMGIVNLTPDSFYSSSRVSREDLISKVGEMINEGVDIIDIGGYSSRPGAADIDETEELNRVVNAISTIKDSFPDCVISIDTFRSKVAQKAIEAGADIINDISGGQSDNEMFDVVAHHNVPYVLMHMRGTPKTMQHLTHYDDMMGELIHFFSERIQQLNLKGVHDIIIDPGFGFSKTRAQNFYLLQHLSELHILNTPILAGLSRKSFIYKSLNIEVGDALNGTSAVNMLALQQGVEILRVHDVKECKELVNLYTFMKNQ
jgi:dihydropteroate synthase